MAEPLPEGIYTPPPLSLRDNLWRYAVMVGFSLFIWVPTIPDQMRHPLLLVMDVSFGLLSFVLVWFRRRWPLTITLIVTALGAFALTPNGPSNLAAVSLATHRVWRKLVAYCVTSMACALSLTYVQPTPGATRYEIMASAFALTLATIGWGAYIGSHRELVWNLTHRAADAEAQADLLAQQARVTERATIAREMHDVLAHRITQVSLQSGALAYRKDLTAEQLRAGADVIRVQANRALEELRSVLGVLRDDDGEPIDRPQPAYADIAELIEQARDTGMKVRYDNDLEDVPPDLLGRAAYRFVQEALTNAAKHAPGANVSVQVSGDRDAGMFILVRNPLGFGPTPTPESGFGLIGLQERVELAGGRLRAGTDQKTFELSGWLPWAP